MAESALNADIAEQGLDLARACKPGALVAVDLTDPLFSSEEANGIFQARERALLPERLRAVTLGARLPRAQFLGR